MVQTQFRILFEADVKLLHASSTLESESNRAGASRESFREEI